MNVVVRKASRNEEDFLNIMELAGPFINEHKMGSLSAENANYNKIVRWVLDRLDSGAWIAEYEGKPIGSISVYETTTWYSDSVYLTDGWFFVLQEYRDQKVGMMLLEAAKTYAEAVGLPLIVGIFNMDNAEQKMAMLQRRGFKLAGGLFMVGA